MKRGQPLAQGLHLDPETRQEARQRLLSVKGHVDGLVRMLDDPRVCCVDVLKQMKAVRGALVVTGDRVLKSHLREHVATAAIRGDTDSIVEELMDALKYR
jgi:CsoR family transcriptional regulator, copper-sensing transcriptional repressor